MREVLFRGKQKDYGGWLIGDLMRSYDSKYWIVTHDTEGNYASEIISETVGQFTGLHDKNGKRIFEGDIVDILTENEEIGVVAYEDGGFLVNADGFCVDFHSNINGTDLEVIDNIHDKEA